FARSPSGMRPRRGGSTATGRACPKATQAPHTSGCGKPLLRALRCRSESVSCATCSAASPPYRLCCYLEHRHDPPQDLGRRLGGGGEEGGEVEVALAAGEIAEAADDDAGRIELGGDLRHGGALHLHGLRLEAIEESFACDLAVDELVAGQNRPEADRRLSRRTASHSGGQRRQSEAVEAIRQAPSNVRRDIEA